MKTKIQSLLLLLWVVPSLFAQDWACIKPLDTVYFINTYSPHPIEKLIRPVIVENTVTSNDTILYDTTSKWIGKNSIQLSNGYNLFTNAELDTLYINTLANINDNWVFYKYDNDNYVEAEVINIQQEDFIGITDEIKTIKLQLKDVNGTTIESFYDEAFIKLSKNHGFVKIFNIYSFPPQYNIHEMKLVGFSEFGYKNFGAAEIFDFDIGDEIHTTERVDIWDEDPFVEEHTEHKKIITVIAKYISPDGSFMNYTFERCNGTIEVLSIDMTKPEYACYNQISATYKDYIDETGYCKRIFIGSDLDSKYIISIQEGYDINNLTLTFPVYPFPFPYTYHYKIGYGGPYYFHEYHMNWFESRYLTNHISCSHLLETEELYADNVFSIYPNPVNDNLNISINNENSSTPYTLFITDMTGKRHRELKQNLSEFTIDTSKLSDGMYIVQLISDKGVITRKFMVRH